MSAAYRSPDYNPGNNEAQVGKIKILIVKGQVA